MSRSGWTMRAVASLNSVDSWTGRIHVHKLLFLGDRILDLKQPFQFKIYKYGPYSFDLDQSILELESSSILERFVRNPSYGPSYRSVQDDLDRYLADGLDISDDEKKKLQAIANEIGDEKSSDLELVATCVWAIVDEKLSDDAAVVSRVHSLKPRYPEQKISEKLVSARKLISKFS